jgi:hypothetical protein
MGILDLNEEPKHLDIVKRRLARRGLKPCLDEEWDIHGTHEGMNYQVYVGTAYEEPEKGAKCICPDDYKQKGLEESNCPAHRTYYCVAIYPWGICEIEDFSEWGWDSENRILCIAKEERGK